MQTLIFNTTEKYVIVKENFNSSDILMTYKNVPTVRVEANFYEVMQKIKEIVRKQYSWFYLKQIKTSKDRDRMENEELLTSLVFLQYYLGKTCPRVSCILHCRACRIRHPR